MVFAQSYILANMVMQQPEMDQESPL